MALPVPPEKNVRNAAGVYTLNRNLSDSSQPALKQQGVGFLVRQAIQHSNVETTLTQYTDPEGLGHLDQVQVSTGNVKNAEERVMDWKPRETENWIWGKVTGWSRYTKLSEVEDEWLREGWEQEMVDGEIVEGYVESLTDTWKARQLWGFAVVDGVRRHVRRILAQKPGWKDERFQMVYDWKHELPSA